MWLCASICVYFASASLPLAFSVLLVSLCLQAMGTHLRLKSACSFALIAFATQLLKCVARSRRHVFL